MTIGESGDPLEVQPHGASAYSLYVERDWSRLLAEDLLGSLKASRLFIVSQRRLREPVLGDLAAALPQHFPGGLDDERVIYIEEGEAAKQFANLETPLNRLIELGADRKSCLLAVGGGVVGDFTGFLAAILLRGVPFVQFPSTLLAAVDSSVGGKTGVNVNFGKNMVGAFYHPRFVYFNQSLLRTLPPREWICGLAEMFKHALLEESGAHLRDLENSGARLLDPDGPELRRAVRDSIAFKAKIVSLDEKESGLRSILNFGHTTAHALESFTHYKRFLHGEAVARGLATALLLSRRLRGLSDADLERCFALMEKLALPCDTAGLSAEDLLRHMTYDKKVEDGRARFVLLSAPGKYEFGCAVSDADFRATWREQAARFG